MIFNNQCVDNKSGSALVLEACTGGPTQQWSVNPNGTIEDIQTSTKCFRASGSSVVAGSCSGTASEWTFSGTTITPPPSSAPPTTTPTTTTPPTTTPPSGNKVYEADKATIGGSADANSCAACLDGEKVSAIGGGGAGTVTVTVHLNAGSTNTITFSGSGTTGAPDLDHILV